MLARIVDSVKLAPPTATAPLPCSSPSVTPLSSTQAAAVSSAVWRSTSTAALSSTSCSVVSSADTASRAGRTAGLAPAKAALTAGMTLSAFCRFMSSSSTTSWSPATGAQASPEAPPVASASPPVPEEPDSPQAAVSAAARASGRSIRVRAPMSPPSVSRAALRPRRVSGGRSPAATIEQVRLLVCYRSPRPLRFRYRKRLTTARPPPSAPELRPLPTAALTGATAPSCGPG